MKQTADQNDEEVVGGKGLTPHTPSLRHTPAKIQFQSPGCTPIVKDKPLRMLGGEVQGLQVAESVGVGLGYGPDRAPGPGSSEESVQLISRKHIFGSIFYYEF